jgi:acetyltransferase-like isoleucine patch superfamily enzyme
MTLSRIEHAQIDADLVLVGQGVSIAPDASIAGPGGKRARLVAIGDHVSIGAGVKLWAPEVRVGDYTRVRDYVFSHGPEPLRIGRNVYLGRGVVMDSYGALTIEDNVCVSTACEVTTHSFFGDPMMGLQARFQHKTARRIQHDAWLYPHCLVGPVAVGPWSIALGGSVITKAMQENRVYGGNPAQDLTDKLGKPYESPGLIERATWLARELAAFDTMWFYWAKVLLPGDEDERNRTNFDVMARTYTPTGGEQEVAFLKWTQSKWTPAGAPDFVDAPIEELIEWMR